MKKLKLNKSTIRSLTRASVAHVAGGAKKTNEDLYCTMTCATCKPKNTCNNCDLTDDGDIIIGTLKLY